MTYPLSGLLVLDLTRFRSGPTAVRQLADWGADVIRIEAPLNPDDAADPVKARHGADFQSLQRNKRSIALDLKSVDGKKIFMDLAARADVVVENYRPGVKKRLGIDQDTLRAHNPRLIYASISGFGQDGPYAERPGFDQIAQGTGGLMSITGLPGQGPVRAGIPIADLSAGLYCAIGILMALLERTSTGEGKWVRTSLLQAQVSMLDFQAARWLVDGKVPQQAGNDHPTTIPTGMFPTIDGHINIATAGSDIFIRLCDAIGASSLATDPRFTTGQSRSKHRVELNALIGEQTALKTTAEWVEALNAAGVPCGPINSIDAVFDDPQVNHLGLAQPVHNPAIGDTQILGQALQYGDQPFSVRRPAPEIGEHSDEILAWLGYDKAAIEALHSKGTIQGPDTEPRS